MGLQDKGFVDRMSDNHFLKKDPAPWRWLCNPADYSERRNETQTVRVDFGYRLVDISALLCDGAKYPMNATAFLQS
jgi:hypothetical protein